MPARRPLAALSACALALAGCNVAGVQECAARAGPLGLRGARTVDFTVANDADAPPCVRVLVDGELAFQGEFAPRAGHLMGIVEGAHVLRTNASQMTVTVEETTQGLRQERSFTLAEKNYVSIVVGRTIFLDHHEAPPAFA